MSVYLFCSASKAAPPTYVLSKDTVLNTPWVLGETVLEIRNNARILKGDNGRISGGYILCPYYQQIFDSSLVVEIKGGAFGVISTSWFGASPSKDSNRYFFQKAVTCAISTNSKLYTPANGIYKIWGQIDVMSVYLGDFSGCSVYWYGDYRFNGANGGTVFSQQQKYASTLNLQKNKGTTIEGIRLVGKYTSPALTPMQFFNATYASYRDSTCSNWYTGISIDAYPPMPGGSTGGSTGVFLRNLSVENFTVLIGISQNGQTLNAEGIVGEYINFGAAREGWKSGQAQEKGNRIAHCFFWEPIFYGISIGNSGQYSSGNYWIDHINVAGRMNTIFKITQGSWFPTFISNVYAESTGKLGDFSTSSMTISLTDCVINFEASEVAGVQNIITSNSLRVIFTRCNLQYWPTDQNLVMSGLATFVDCRYPSQFKASNANSKFVSSYQFINP